MAWISCCGDLRTFRKQEKTPLLSRNRHGRILIEGEICFSLKHPSGIPECPEKTDMEKERRRAYASDWLTIGTSLCTGYRNSLSCMQISCGDFRRCSGNFIRDRISGGVGAVLCSRVLAGAFMAGDRVPDQPLRSANGGGLAGGDHRRRKQRVKGFRIWLNSFGGTHWQPRPFSIIMAVCYGSFLIGGI